MFSSRAVTSLLPRISTIHRSTFSHISKPTSQSNHAAVFTIPRAHAASKRTPQEIAAAKQAKLDRQEAREIKRREREAAKLLEQNIKDTKLTLRHLKPVKLSTPELSTVPLGDTPIERYFVVGIDNCPGIAYLKETLNFLMSKYPPTKPLEIHYSTYSPLEYETRRIEILQALRLHSHVVKTSPLVFATETKLIPPVAIFDGLDRGAFPRVYVGNAVQSIDHFTRRLVSPDKFPNAHSAQFPFLSPHMSLPLNDYPGTAPYNWTQMVLRNPPNGHVIHTTPPRKSTNLDVVNFLGDKAVS